MTTHGGKQNLGKHRSCKRAHNPCNITCVATLVLACSATCGGVQPLLQVMGTLSYLGSMSPLAYHAKSTDSIHMAVQPRLRFLKQEPKTRHSNRHTPVSTL